MSNKKLTTDGSDIKTLRDPFTEKNIRILVESYGKSVEKIKKLKAENEKLRECVEFFASEFKEITLDGFNNDYYYGKARQTLKEILERNA